MFLGRGYRLLQGRRGRRAAWHPALARGSARKHRQEDKRRPAPPSERTSTAAADAAGGFSTCCLWPRSPESSAPGKRGARPGCGLRAPRGGHRERGGDGGTGPRCRTKPRAPLRRRKLTGRRGSCKMVRPRPGCGLTTRSRGPAAGSGSTGTPRCRAICRLQRVGGRQREGGALPLLPRRQTPPGPGPERPAGPTRRGGRTRRPAARPERRPTCPGPAAGPWWP